MKNKLTICIVGASFAGLSALLMLRKRLGDNVVIHLFDSQEKFTYIPGLHETVGDSSQLASLQFDLSRYYSEYHCATVDRIDSHQLYTQDGQVYYFDYCIIATGSRTRFFTQEQQKYAYTLCKPEDVEKLNTILSLPSTKHITIIGGGYTGVEIASVLAQRKRPDQHITVVHGRERLFERLSENISNVSLQWLDRHHVTTIMNAQVKDITSSSVVFEDGTLIESDCTIAAWGIRVNDETFSQTLTFENHYHSTDADHIYLCGDVAKHGLAATAHNAMFEGRRVAELIADKIQQVENSYSPLVNRDKMAIALGLYDGIVTNGMVGTYVPRLVGFSKKIIQWRVMIEFMYRIMFPI